MNIQKLFQLFMLYWVFFINIAKFIIYFLFGLTWFEIILNFLFKMLKNNILSVY